MRGLSISPTTVSLSLFLPRARPLDPLLNPRAPAVPPRCADPRASYTAGSPRHDARHRATAGTDRPVVCLSSPTTRVATSPSSSSLFFFFPLYLLFFFRVPSRARTILRREFVVSSRLVSSRLGVRSESGPREDSKIQVEGSSEFVIRLGYLYLRIAHTFLEAESFGSEAPLGRFSGKSRLR